MLKTGLIGLFVILSTTLYSQGGFSQQDRGLTQAFGGHTGGLSGISVDYTLMYANPIEIIPFINMELGTSGTKYRLGILIWSSPDGPRSEFIANKTIKLGDPIVGIDFSINYANVWLPNMDPEILLGYGNKKGNYFGYEVGFTLFQLNYKFGIYNCESGKLYTHSIGYNF